MEVHIAKEGCSSHASVLVSCHGSDLLKMDLKEP